MYHLNQSVSRESKQVLENKQVHGTLIVYLKESGNTVWKYLAQILTGLGI
jgi:hypothetical protein